MLLATLTPLPHPTPPPPPPPSRASQVGHQAAHVGRDRPRLQLSQAGHHIGHVPMEGGEKQAGWRGVKG